MITISQVRGLVISSNTVVNSATAYTESVHVEKNAYFAFLAGTTHTFSQDVTVDGGIYFGEYRRTYGMTLTFGGKSAVTNNGVFVVDDRNANVWYYK